MIKVAIGLAVALLWQPVAAFAQPKLPHALSPQESVVLSYFHDVLDGRKVNRDELGILRSAGVLKANAARVDRPLPSRARSALARATL